ncbi:flagellar motor protein [Pleionea sp. CnH1-48]|uniref:flagellar motor protein n=1 Tax=Pleionea sp. CnH1-48 TaxID=2954494 RepID=UPI002097316B|nr:flagellar motor protein [Pleionea sp. CnH1-48]MCO7226093.1 flagellar motor protein [Pleionea sp. CnH1-48]
MDALTLIGLLFAVFAILGGQVLEGGSIESLANGPAFVIVIGGTLGAVFVQTPLSTLMLAIRMMPWMIFPPQSNPISAIEKITQWSLIARKQGLLGLENILDSERNIFDNKGLSLLVDGGEPERIRETLMIELDVREREGVKAAKVFEALGGYAPTLGIVGAVLGLIQVMGNLSEPALLGTGIATAFVATIYGVASANLLFLPIANKLKSIVQTQSLHREMMIEGIVLISEGENPKVIESRLRGFVPDKGKV